MKISKKFKFGITHHTQTMPSKKNAKKNEQEHDFTCKHNPFELVRLKNRENPADIKILLVLHASATDDPVIVRDVIRTLLRFEETHNKGECPYNIVIECSDGKVVVSKDGKKNFNVRETMEWLVPFN